MFPTVKKGTKNALHKRSKRLMTSLSQVWKEYRRCDENSAKNNCGVTGVGVAGRRKNKSEKG
jgi:hypothetical protein